MNQEKHVLSFANIQKKNKKVAPPFSNFWIKKTLKQILAIKF